MGREKKGVRESEYRMCAIIWTTERSLGIPKEAVNNNIVASDDY